MEKPFDADTLVAAVRRAAGHAVPETTPAR
jgi:hypothetical protein